LALLQELLEPPREAAERRAEMAWQELPLAPWRPEEVERQVPPDVEVVELKPSEPEEEEQLPRQVEEASRVK